MIKSSVLFSASKRETSLCLAQLKHKTHIPWHSTQAITNGIVGLNRIYKFLDESSNLKLFINAHCVHLLSPMTGTTDISISLNNPKVLKTLPNVIRMTPTFRRNLFWDLPGYTGVYVFITNNKLIQCGSSTGFINRIQSHYIGSKNGVFMFGVYPITEYYWVPLKYTTIEKTLFFRYVWKYLETHSNITSDEEQILTFFTQQEIRTIEQAYSHFSKPLNYKGTPVNMWHSNWVQGNNYKIFNTGKKVFWFDSYGNIFNRGSISARAIELGFGPDRVRTVAFITGAKLKTKKYGMVTINIEGISKKDYYPDLRSGTPLNTEVNPSGLENNMYYIYDADMNRLLIGPFKTAALVKKALGLPAKYTGVATWCNYMHLLYSPKLTCSVYVYKVHINTDIPMYATNVNAIGDNREQFETLKGMCKKIGITLSALLVRITHNTTFTNERGVTYLFDCQNSEDKTKLIARYQKKLEYGRQQRKLTKFK